MSSRLLAFHESRLQGARSVFEQAQASSELALHHFRLGWLDEAATHLGTARRHLGGDFDPDLAARVLLAEAVEALQRNDAAQALERLRKAVALASSVESCRALPRTLAWLAYHELNFGDFDRFCDITREAVDAGIGEDTEAVIRMAISLGSAARYCRDHAGSERFFGWARHLASTLGDREAIAAVAHNQASFAVHEARLARLFAVDIVRDDAPARSFLRASVDLDAMFSIKSRAELPTFLQLQVLVHDGQAAPALALLQARGAELRSPMYRCYAALVRVDEARAQVEAGGPAACALDEVCEQVERCLADVRKPDDRALVLGCLAGLAHRLGAGGQALEYRQMANAEYAGYLELAAEFGACMGEAGLSFEELSAACAA